jgi:hypothetical protein
MPGSLVERGGIKSPKTLHYSLAFEFHLRTFVPGCTLSATGLAQVPLRHGCQELCHRVEILVAFSVLAPEKIWATAEVNKRGTPWARDESSAKFISSFTLSSLSPG